MTVFSPWVFSDHKPDTFSLEHFAASPVFAGIKDEELAIAFWRYFSDPEIGVYHYCPAQDRFRDREIHDPVKILNCFGFAICHIHAHILAQAFIAAGYKARIACISGHEGSEIFYDEGWHYFDCDLRGFSRRHPPEEKIIASREDMYRDPTIVSQQENPSEPFYYVEDRPPELIAELVKSTPEYLRPFDELLHTMDMTLRPGESIIRRFDNEGKYIIFSNYRQIWKRYWKEPGPGGPLERWEPHRKWGNGTLIYHPNLTPDYADLDIGASAVGDIVQTRRGIEAARGTTGRLVFDFDIPYPIAGIPDETGMLPPRDGARAIITSFRNAPNDGIMLKLSFDGGKSFETVWFDCNPGEKTTSVDLTPLLENRFRFQLMLEVTTAPENAERFDSANDRSAGISEFRIELDFMNSPWSLPEVRSGEPTRMKYHAFDKVGLPTRKMFLEVALNDREQFEEALAESANLAYDPTSFSVLSPKDPEKGDYEAVFRMNAPSGGKFAWAYASVTWEGRKPGEELDSPCKLDVRDGEDGEWVTIDEVVPDEHAMGWHIIKGAEARFSGENPVLFFRLRGQKGAVALRVAAHYIPEDISQDYENPPMEIIHYWKDYRLKKVHREAISAGAREHEYVINGGKKVTNIAVEMRAPSIKK